MATNHLSIRMSPRLRDEFHDLCERQGISACKAAECFVRQLVESGKLPFSLDDDRNYANEEQIRVSIYMACDIRQQFSDACKAIDETLSMSYVMRGFMEYCVERNEFPFYD